MSPCIRSLQFPFFQENTEIIGNYVFVASEHEEAVKKLRQEGEAKINEVLQEMKSTLEKEIQSKLLPNDNVFSDLKVQCRNDPPFLSLLHLLYYRQTGWIGTLEVNRDTCLK